MNFEILNTERLVLRKLTPNDYFFIFNNYSENEIRNILGIYSDDDFKTEKEKNEKGYSTYHTTILLFQIIDKKTHKIIGKCGFHNWYMEHCRAELGLALTNENYKNKGIMKEALKAVVEYGFEKMKLNKIEAHVGINNLITQRLLKKYNFQREGYLRQHFKIDNKFEDSLVLSLLKDEYDNNLILDKNKSLN